MAHAKAVNRKKNNDDYEDSPHHDGTQPITGGDQGQGDDYENAPLPPPKKKKNKIKPPTSLNSSGVGMYVFLKKSMKWDYRQYTVRPPSYPLSIRKHS